MKLKPGLRLRKDSPKTNSSKKKEYPKSFTRMAKSNKTKANCQAIDNIFNQVYYLNIDKTISIK